MVEAAIDGTLAVACGDFAFVCAISESRGRYGLERAAMFFCRHASNTIRQQPCQISGPLKSAAV
jgi:hypothetical protein